MSTLVTGAPVLVRTDGPVASVTLNNPEKRNPLSLAVMEELIAALQGLGRDPRVRAIVIDGRWPAFSAGHDMGEMAGREETFHQRLFGVCTELMEGLHRLPQPVVAKVDGIATGAGCQLVAACDLAVASDRSRFVTPGVRMGLWCATPMVPLTRAIGRKRALEMLLTAEPVDAATALEWGLVNRVVPPDGLDAAVAELIGPVLRAAPGSVGIGKEAFYAQIEVDEHRAYEIGTSVMATNAPTPDVQEGMSAFLEKRAPAWRDAAGDDPAG
jgi:enoyl-CoA hydratase/carnithine racemase